MKICRNSSPSTVPRGAVCQWHTLSANRNGAETAVCQWHTLSAERSEAETAVCQWHTLSADRSGVPGNQKVTR